MERYPSGTVVTLRAGADPGSVFDGWSGDCTEELASSIQVTMNSDKTCTARFNSQGPDLTGEWGRMRNYATEVGTFFRGTLRVRNIGPMRASAPFTISFYLSSGGINLDALLGMVLMRSGIRSRSHKSAAFLLFSATPPTGKYIVAIVDSVDQVAEAHERNNKAVYGPLN